MTSRTRQSAQTSEMKRIPAPARTSEPKRARQPARTSEPKRTRAPAIYRGADAPIAAADHVEGRAFIRWRFVSGFVVVVLLIVLGVFFGADAFYVHEIAVAGLETMTYNEIYMLSGIADTQIFWVDPLEVRRNLLESPTIADAQISVRWEVPMVQILIQEREPALVWQQGDTETWIDVQGRVMEQRGERPDLLRVVVEGETDIIPERIELNTVTGALQLRELLPDTRVLRYSSANGLGIVDPGGWSAWFGDGVDIPEKILVYNAIIADLLERGVAFETIFVINPDSPWRR